MNVSEPLYGWMTDRDAAPRRQRPGSRAASSSPVSNPRSRSRRTETLSGPGVTGAEVLAVTECVAPAIDVLDSRFTGYKFTLADVTADNSSAAAYAVGEPVAPRRATCDSPAVSSRRTAISSPRRRGRQ